jgi:hypothetical protein
MARGIGRPLALEAGVLSNGLGFRRELHLTNAYVLFPLNQIHLVLNLGGNIQTLKHVFRVS